MRSFIYQFFHCTFPFPVWTNDGEFLVVTGFSTRSERTVSVYRWLLIFFCSSSTIVKGLIKLSLNT